MKNSGRPEHYIVIIQNKQERCNMLYSVLNSTIHITNIIVLSEIIGLTKLHHDLEPHNNPSGLIKTECLKMIGPS